MSFQQKIRLENRIFACANQVRADIHAKAGRLVSSSKDELLQALLGVYNAFFCQQNWNKFCAQETGLAGLYAYHVATSRVPVFSVKDYKFEMIVGGKNAKQ